MFTSTYHIYNMYTNKKAAAYIFTANDRYDIYIKHFSLIQNITIFNDI